MAWDEVSAIDDSGLQCHVGPFADRLVPEHVGRPVLRLRLVLQMVALVQNQSHEEVAGVAGVNEEPRHEFLATELPVGEPLEGLTLDLG